METKHALMSAFVLAQYSTFFYAYVVAEGKSYNFMHKFHIKSSCVRVKFLLLQSCNIFTCKRTLVTQVISFNDIFKNISCL